MIDDEGGNEVTTLPLIINPADMREALLRNPAPSSPLNSQVNQ